jgi:hypothetical protein
MGRPRTWTDDQLIAAIDASKTLVEVLDRLGLVRGGSAMHQIRKRMVELGLDKPELLERAWSPQWRALPEGMQATVMRSQWTEEALREAVRTSFSIRQAVAALGYAPGGGAWLAVKAQILALGLDTSHFGQDRRTATTAPSPAQDRRTWTDEQLAEAVQASHSIAGVLRALRLKPGGSVYVTMKQRIRELSLDTSHFTGRGWLRGRKGQRTAKRRPLSEILVQYSTYPTALLRQRLIEEGLRDARCEVCGIAEWNGKPAPLQLDHINGIRTDHRLENLRILCGNCHAQTDTWCVKNRGRPQAGPAGAVG